MTKKNVMKIIQEEVVVNHSNFEKPPPDVVKSKYQ